MPRLEILQRLRKEIEAFAAEGMDFRFDPARPAVKLHEPTFGAEEVTAGLEVLLSTRVTMGERVRRFEAECAAYHRSRHAMMVNSGSSANLLAVSALANPSCKDGLKPGDEVIVPALSWSTSIWPVIQCGLVPVVVDLDPATLNAGAEEIERAIGPRTRGVVLVHVYGNPCAMDAIMDLARRRNLVVIEDCCEALGASFGGRMVGTFGRAGTFSFYFSHHITTLEGGLVVSDDAELADLCRILRAHGWVREVSDPSVYQRKYPDIDPRFLFVNVGYNLRATELQAAIGSIQLPKLDGFVEIRRENARFWRERFARFEDELVIPEETAGGRHSYFGFPMLVLEAAPFTTKDLCRHLNDRHIETRPIIAGNIAAQPAMKLFPHRLCGDLRHASRVMRQGFTYGNHQAVDGPAREYVAGAIEEFMAGKGIR